jgi:hypothetical protein
MGMYVHYLHIIFVCVENYKHGESEILRLSQTYFARKQFILVGIRSQICVIINLLENYQSRVIGKSEVINTHRLLLSHKAQNFLATLPWQWFRQHTQC